MKRRDFIKKSCAMASACFAFSAVSVLQSCEDNIDENYNLSNENEDDSEQNQLAIDISQSPHTNLNNINGTSYIGSNVIDSQGLLLVKSSETKIKAYSRRCTHSSYIVNAFNNQGVAICSSGHGGSFNLNGNVTAGPPSSSLRSYATSLDGNILTISK